MTDRFHENHYLLAEFALSRINVTDLIERIQTFVSAVVPKLEEALGGVHGPMNIYTGKVGIVMAYLRAKRLLVGHNLPYPDLNVVGGEIRRKGRSIGFTSDPICFQLYESLRLQQPFDLDPEIYSSTSLDEELLNGRCGLAVLIDYFHNKGMPLSNPHIIDNILSHVKVDSFPWEWGGKVYFGAAHGTSGILLTLSRLGHRSFFDLFEQLVNAARIPSSGNFKSSQASKKDILVQWCHGATGFIPLLVEYQNQLPSSIEKATNLTQMLEALRTIWQRGLLRKGCGVCHGIAGSGYAFLSAYVFTLNVQHLSEAIAFASEILKQGPTNCCAYVDHLYSLFEGLAGTIHFLIDLKEILLLHEAGDTESIHHYVLFDGLRIF